MIVSTSSETGDGISYPWLLTGRIITFNYEVESGGCFINSDASFLGTEKKYRVVCNTKLCSSRTS